MALPKINVPMYDLYLPSTGAKLKMRPYLVKEEKVLMIALESSDPGQIAQSVRNVISSCYSIENVDDLTTFDIEYLFLQLRGKSVGEDMELQLKCDKCDTLNPLVVNVNDVKMTNISDKTNVVMITDEVGLKMKWPSVKTFGSIDATKLNSVEGLMDLIMECIESIFDADAVYNRDEMGKDELVDFIDNLNSAQFKKVQAFFQDIPAVEYKTKLVCHKCEEENEIELKGLQSFFS
jgi:hypothetical protein|tara:strand:+ start:594 stop:1298 length:705 start_codon:yes stop_codon:yes gene_type:complete